MTFFLSSDVYYSENRDTIVAAVICYYHLSSSYLNLVFFVVLICYGINRQPSKDEYEYKALKIHLILGRKNHNSLFVRIGEGQVEQISLKDQLIKKFT